MCRGLGECPKMCCFFEIVEGLTMVDVDFLKGGSEEVRKSREGRLEAAAFCSAPRTMASVLDVWRAAHACAQSWSVCFYSARARARARIRRSPLDQPWGVHRTRGIHDARRDFRRSLPRAMQSRPYSSLTPVRTTTRIACRVVVKMVFLITLRRGAQTCRSCVRVTQSKLV